MIIFSIFPIENNKIIFISFRGKGYGDNGKYIANELIKKENIKILWATRKKYKDSLPKKIKYVRINSIKYLFHLTTSKVWVNNSRFLLGIKKRREQFYIQTWHSTVRMKKIEKDAENQLPRQTIAESKADSKMIDLIISGSEFSTNIYKNSFWYDGEILNCGLPRCDVFFNNKNKKVLKEKIANKYGFNLDNKVILYAPTFRTKENSNQFLNCDELYGYLKEKYTIMVRTHPLASDTLEGTKNSINVTDYPDIQELIAISDFLITDYSGCSFDMMINKKPCILFQKDKETYLKNERELYFNFNELPFPMVSTEKDLSNSIMNFNLNKYIMDVSKFNDKIILYENGKATKTICKLIYGVMKNEKI